MNSTLATKIKFFQTHAGYVEGRRFLGAVQLAKAEIYAETLDWHVYEGPPEICEGCNEETESAYGDPDADSDT